MPRVFIPPQLRTLTGDVGVVEVSAASVAEAIAELELLFPGIRERLCDGNELRAGLSVAVGGSVTALGLLQKTRADDEIHFLPSIGGG